MKVINLMDALRKTEEEEMIVALEKAKAFLISNGWTHTHSKMTDHKTTNYGARFVRRDHFDNLQTFWLNKDTIRYAEFTQALHDMTKGDE